MNKENLQLLKYDQLWLDYNVLTLDLLQTQVNEFKNGKDVNTEHYRYTTFKNYLQIQTSLSEELISKLFDIIKIDSDISMASAMAIDILKTKTLTESQFNMVADFLKYSFGDDMQKYIDREILWRQKHYEEENNR
jgi:hypothetical protein